MNIPSIAGYEGFPRSAAYCASIGAVELMSRTVGAELGPKDVRVNCIAPGNIRTPRKQAQFEASREYEKSLEDLTPSGRIRETEDIATVVYLWSPAAKLVNGASSLVDDGWPAQ